MSIEVICPLYNAENYIVNLNDSLLKQDNVNIININYILTSSNDNSEAIMNKNNIKYTKIDKESFSHSLTREKAALNSTADIIVFITQDIEIRDNLFLYKLIKPIIDNRCEATYARQIAKDNSIEKYTRESNYPNVSIIKNKDDISTFGLKTFFSSDAAAAIKKDIFIKLNGYDNKDLPINEDMYFSYKLIMNNYRLGYIADAVVYHSHNFTLKQIYNRYKDIGKFFKENSYLNKYKANKSGKELARYILKRAFQDKNYKVVFKWLPNMAARYFGMKAGER